MERIILEIIDLTDQGSGLAKTKDNRVVFVPLTVPGDLVECDIYQKRKNIWQASNIEILKQSSERVTPPCEYFPNKPNEIGCGGCQIQHLSYQRLLDFKEKFVKDKLQRIGGINLSDIDMKPILQMEKPWHYRNHVQLKIEYDDTLDQFRKGFFSNTSHKIVNHKTCYISQTGEELIWRTIDEFLIQSPLREIFKRHWKELIIRSGENTDQLLLAFVLDSIPTNIDNDFKSEWAKFSKIFQATDSSKKLVSIWLLAENDVDKDLNVYGYPYFSEKLLGKEFQIYPRSFFQINSKQVEKTYSILVEFIAQEKTKTKRTLYDLYCGTGTIGLILSEYFTQVKGIEIFPDSVSNAKQNAKINKISNATFHLGKAEKWLINQDVDKADTIIVNPPRKGLAKSLVDTLNQVKASSLIYISCHPGTLARDLKTLKEKWHLESIQVVDMFPWTTHVEAVVLMSRIDK